MSGNEILIKVVAQAIPSFIMNYYRSPVGVCQEIEGMLSKFYGELKMGRGKYIFSAGTKIPIYVWRSILSAMECVTKGSKWLIGTGAKVHIWKDNWIPGVAGFKPVSSVCVLNCDAKDCDLIDHHLGC
ncbi:unnamed protein product [Vicia faba]|uniref:Uncharacterized protein n=1 Tax=Vicia faba TaxID=3906 RepID=A0AAV0Z6P5_VICFA|nr:unnamed protein product [Vicia faba]